MVILPRKQTVTICEWLKNSVIILFVSQQHWTALEGPLLCCCTCVSCDRLSLYSYGQRNGRLAQAKFQQVIATDAGAPHPVQHQDSSNCFCINQFRVTFFSSHKWSISDILVSSLFHLVSEDVGNLMIFDDISRSSQMLSIWFASTARSPRVARGSHEGSLVLAKRSVLEIRSRRLKRLYQYDMMNIDEIYVLYHM